MCRLNSNQFESLAEMALYVCDQAFKLNVTEYQETSRQRAAKALTSMFHGKMNYFYIFYNSYFDFTLQLINTETIFQLKTYETINFMYMNVKKQRSLALKLYCMAMVQEKKVRIKKCKVNVHLFKKIQ